MSYAMVANGCATCGQTYRFTPNEELAARLERRPRVRKHIASVCPECRRIDFAAVPPSVRTGGR